MASILRAFATMSLFCAAFAAQTRSAPVLCPTLLGICPVDFKIDEPLRQRARFEIRACGDGRGSIQLLGFKANAKSPSLVEPGEPIDLLIHSGTLVVVQMIAGSSSPTFVAQFRNGKPMLLSREDGVGGVTYSEHGEYAIITIPQKTFPVNGKFPNVPPHRYRLKIRED